MSRSLTDDVVALTRQLIEKSLSISENSKVFRQVERSVLNHIGKSDSLYFSSEKEVQRIIDSLSNKFILHGYLVPAKDLKRLFRVFMGDGLSKPEKNTRLNIIKFLLEVSESPTSNIENYSQKFAKGDVEDVIDWPSYLKEGIPRWNPVFEDESSDCWSEDLSDCFLEEDVDGSIKLSQAAHSHSLPLQENLLLTYRESKVNLLKNVQSEWFNSKQIMCRPASGDSSANVALLWDEFINNSTKGLLAITNSNVVSEYKIMREIIWQLRDPHSSSCFQFIGDSLLPKSDITIASVRSQPFVTFLHEFVPYINWLQNLNDFHHLMSTYDPSLVTIIPDTYKSYNFGVRMIIKPVYDQLQVIEDEIKAQESTYTLLKLAVEFKSIFKTVKILHNTHQTVVKNFEENSSVDCATTLLCSLHDKLFHTSTKLEQDIYLTLYLQSLFKYFTIINSWLVRDNLEDVQDEFVISDKNPKDSHVIYDPSLMYNNFQNNILTGKSSKVQQGEQDWQMEFIVKEMDEVVKSNPLIVTICSEVMQIGKNVHLLRLLKKLHLIPEFTAMHKESLYEAFINKVLEEISLYFQDTIEKPELKEPNQILEQPLSSYIFPATCPDDCKYLTEMDKLENLIDTSNGLLMKAFQSFYIKKPEVKEVEPEFTLFEKISKLTKNLFPSQQIIERVFVEILKSRFSISGLMIKNVLTNDYNLEKQFLFLKNVFLFNDDLIFPLYRRIFEQLNSNGMWGNNTWLTSYLQDIIMDRYPLFYKDCTVEVKNYWKLCTDPLKACKMINIHYIIRWPVNIIIRDEHMVMYGDLFQFILKIKWALYTLNHLYFADLEPKGQSTKSQPKSLRLLISKLKTLRFGLINIFSNIQHYVLGHLFNKYRMHFEKAFANASDLDSLIKSHTDFIQSFHMMCMDLLEYKSLSYGFQLLLCLVRKLKTMWGNLRDIKDEELIKCCASYLACYKNLDPIINPSNKFSYIDRK